MQPVGESQGRPSMQRGILLICPVISDRTYSWQKVPGAGSFRTTSCLAQFMCVKTDSHQRVTRPGWSRVQSITWSLWSFNISGHFFKTSQFSINFPSCRIREIWLCFKHAWLIFPSHQNMYISMFCTTELRPSYWLLQLWLLLFRRGKKSDPENHWRLSEDPSEGHKWRSNFSWLSEHIGDPASLCQHMNLTASSRLQRTQADFLVSGQTAGNPANVRAEDRFQTRQFKEWVTDKMEVLRMNCASQCKPSCTRLNWGWKFRNIKTKVKRSRSRHLMSPETMADGSRDEARPRWRTRFLWMFVTLLMTPKDHQQSKTK